MSRTTSATQEQQQVFAGVDTHGQTHHAAVVDSIGRHLGDREFPTTAEGYRALLAWIRGIGELMAVGVEGTGTYGAELARVLAAAGLIVIEVDRPDRKTRRQQGKSDPIDAYCAATAVASGRASGLPKSRDGIVESIRCLRTARRSAVKARTQAINQIRALLITAPSALREQLRPLSAADLVATLSWLRPNADAADPSVAVRVALRSLARRHVRLNDEIDQLDETLAELTEQAAPGLLAKLGVGVQVAAQLLVTAGDNPDRLRSEASFAHLAGVAPIPASSGRIHRLRLNRGGDRHANNALHTIALVRLRYDTATQDYAAKRTAQGLSKKDILRCLKRHIAREIYRELTKPTPQPAAA